MATVLPPRAVRPPGSVSYSDDLNWFIRNFDGLVAAHPDGYLGIRNGEVVLSATTPRELRELIKTRDEFGLLIVRSHPDALLPPAA